jgi:rubredoxin
MELACTVCGYRYYDPRPTDPTQYETIPADLRCPRCKGMGKIRPLLLVELDHATVWEEQHPARQNIAQCLHQASMILGQGAVKIPVQCTLYRGHLGKCAHVDQLGVLQLTWEGQ